MPPMVTLVSLVSLWRWQPLGTQSNSVFVALFRYYCLLPTPNTAKIEEKQGNLFYFCKEVVWKRHTW